jgi:hypothetical protein
MMSGFTKEQETGLCQVLDLDATPQEGMISYSASSWTMSLRFGICGAGSTSCYVRQLA